MQDFVSGVLMQMQIKAKMNDKVKRSIRKKKKKQDKILILSDSLKSEELAV